MEVNSMEKKKLNDNELKQVSGGIAGSSMYPTARYKVGDRVKLAIYPEYGIGTVMSSYFDGTEWKCSVKFDAGIMDASEIEFVPA